MSGTRPTRADLEATIADLQTELGFWQTQSASWRRVALHLERRLKAARVRETRSWWRP